MRRGEQLSGKPNRPRAQGASPDYEHVVREMIAHEHDMYDRRSSLYVATQGFLLAALGVAWTQPQGWVLVSIVVAVGIFTTYILLGPVIAAQKGIRRLERWWRDRLGDADYDGPGVMGLTPAEWGVGANANSLHWVRHVIALFWALIGIAAGYLSWL